MGKVTGAMVTVFLLGGGASGPLAALLGAYAEAAAVALMGAGLLACGSMLGRTEAAPQGMAKEA
jgi:hypothetical protein